MAEYIYMGCLFFWEVWSQLGGLDTSVFSINLFVRWLEVLRSSIHTGSNQIIFFGNLLKRSCVVIYIMLLSDTPLVLLIGISTGLHKSWSKKVLWILTWRHNHVIFFQCHWQLQWHQSGFLRIWIYLVQSSFNRGWVPKARLFHFVLLCWIHVSNSWYSILPSRRLFRTYYMSSAVPLT